TNDPRPNFLDQQHRACKARVSPITPALYRKPTNFSLDMRKQYDILALLGRGNQMNCPTCNAPAKKFGTHRNGLQRYRCSLCKKTFTEPHARPLGDMILAEEKAIAVLQH